jgi:hypothetical protein
MEHNKSNDRNDDQRNADQDKIRSNTMNETIREVSGGPDMNLNGLRDSDQESDSIHELDTEVNRNTDVTQGMSYNPNDTSGVRSGGTVDMDDQTAGGAGANTGTRRGLGSNLTPKMGTTGSDYDGQNSTS